jgi:hypothetical protein
VQQINSGKYSGGQALHRVRKPVSLLQLHRLENWNALGWVSARLQAVPPVGFHTPPQLGS